MRVRPIGVGQAVGLLAIALFVVQLAIGIPLLASAVVGVLCFVERDDRRARWWPVVSVVLLAAALVGRAVANALWDRGML